jgi:hypothetical protein
MGWRSERRVAAKVVFVGALTLQAVLVLHGLSDPHKRFGFRPFNESDVWSAEIVRVHSDLSRHRVDDGTWVYDWDELVGASKVQHLEGPRHASAGARASVDLLERALDWAVDHIPDDHDTIALEARVTTFHNTRGPQVIVLEARRGTDP